MSWNPGVVQTLIDTQQYRLGSVGMEAIRAVIAASQQYQPAVEQETPAISSTTNTDETSQTLRSSTGRLYWVRIENLTAAAVNVVLTTGGDTIVLGGAYVPARVSASIPAVTELAFFGSPNGVGELIPTSLLARAFTAADGTTGAADGVTVFALTSA